MGYRATPVAVFIDRNRSVSHPFHCDEGETKKDRYFRGSSCVRILSLMSLLGSYNILSVLGSIFFFFFFFGGGGGGLQVSTT